MEFSPFRIIVVAIIVIALIYLIFQFFPQSNEETLKEIGKALDFAELNEGKLHSVNLNLGKDLALNGDIFDSRTRSVRFECGSAETCGGEKISFIDSRRLLVKEFFPLEAFFRCVRKETINDCVVYFGESPANLEVSGLSIDGNVKAFEQAQATFKIENTGSLNSLGSYYTIKVYSVKKEGLEELRVLKLEQRGVVNELAAAESQTVAWQFSVQSPGKYVLQVTAEGEDSGKSVSELEFTAVEGVNPSCVTTGEGKTFLENDVCKTEHLCEGCNFGFECKQVWEAGGLPGITDFYPDKVFTEREPLEGACT